MSALERRRARWFPVGVRRTVLVSALLLAVGWALPSAASAALKATQIRIGDHPAFVRVVVDFSGGTLRANDVESPDPAPFDGRARVRVTAPGIRNAAAGVTEEGVHARIVRHPGFIALRLSARKHRFKYLEHSVLHSPERLVVDLWKARPPRPAAEFPTAPQGGCLAITSFNDAPGRVTASGSENDVFEHMFQAVVRRHRGDAVGQRSVTATGGHWHRSVPYTVARAQAGTFEAVDLSEQDGSLVCIAQVRVALQPGP